MVSRIHSAYIENSCSNEINQWFLDVSNLDLVKKRVLNHELNRLFEKDRLFVVSYLVQKGLLHEAAQSHDSLLLLELLNAGANINAVDKHGKTPLEYVKQADLFLELLKKGALPKQETILNLILLYTKQSDANWKTIFSDLLAFVPLDEFVSISQEDTTYLWDQFSQNSQLKDTFVKFIAKFPLEASEVIKRIIGHPYHEKKYLEDIISFFVNGLITQQFFEEILFDSQVLYWNLDHADVFLTLQKHYAPSLILKSDACNDFRFAIYIEALLKTKTLREAVSVLHRIELFEQVVLIAAESIKCSVVKHIESLQKNEKTTIWRAYNEKPIFFKKLKLFQMLGLDPNWVDTNQRNILFSSKIWHTLDEGPSENTLNFEQIDRNGDNALEFFCRTYFTYSKINIEKLTNWGMRLSERFPNFEKCRQLFPEDPFLQALLGTYLMFSQKNRHMIKVLIEGLPDSKKSIFKETVQQHPELNFSDDLIDYSKQSIWKEKIDPCYLETFEKYIGSNYSRRKYLDDICSIWRTPIPLEIFQLFPEFPMLSLLVHSINKQHEEKLLGRSCLPIESFFSVALTRQEMVLFNRHMFDYPEKLKILVDDHMVLMKLNYKARGGSISSYGRVIYSMISAMNKIKHVAAYTFFLPKWHQNLINSFEEKVYSKPIEYLTLPLEKVVQLNRTSVLEEGELADGYKFLKDGEDEERFAQEISVSKAFRQLPYLFKSCFIEPIGLFTAKELDPELEENLKPLGLAKPITFIHYKTSPKTFKYLNDLPLEDYEKSRFLSLDDAAKMVRLGIYPDVAALFHNNEADRRYVLLTDLMAHLKIMSLDNYSPPVGGSGRIDQPFAKTKYPNARDNGLTDLRDATVPYNQQYKNVKDIQGLKWESDSTRYFSQMHGLSSILLVDMLILAEREQKSGRLSWDNDASLQEFGLSLAEAFAHVSASYSERPLDQCRQFALSCGIDWTRAARQIAFWIDTSEKGYPSWIAQGKIPDNIYEKNVQVIVEVEGAKNFDPEKGCSSDGHQDIGLYNGPSGLEEFTKACYLLFIPIALCES